MRGLIKVLIAIGVIVAAGVVALQVPAVQDRLVINAIRKAMDNRELRESLFKDDALRVLVCGSTAPIPAPDRARACIAVIAAGRFYLVDIGPGSTSRLVMLRVPVERIGGVFITHYHSDHIGDLGELNFSTWMAGRPAPLQVYGPEGVTRVVAGFTEAYALDSGYRIAHHGAQMLPAAVGKIEAHTLALSSDGTPVEAFHEGDLKVSVFPVSHQPVEPAVGYRFDYKGRSVVISGDTRKDSNIARVARGADLLAHEALNPQLIATMGALAEELQRPNLAKIFRDIPSNHTSPVEAAELANEAQVPLLLLYHFVPPPPNRIAERVFARGISDIRKEGVVLSHDGTLIELPLGSREWRVRDLL